MQLNSVLFPVPQVEYSAQDVQGEVAFIPRFFQWSK